MALLALTLTVLLLLLLGEGVRLLGLEVPVFGLKLLNASSLLVGGLRASRTTATGRGGWKGGAD